MKPSFNANSMKQFCIDHVEKFVLGGVVLLLLLFAARAVQTVGGGPVPFTPTQMSTEAENAVQHVKSAKPSDYFSGPDTQIEVTRYHEIATRIREKIPGEPYDPKVPYNRPIIPERIKRGVPELLAVEDLRASAGNGALQVSTAGAATGAAPSATATAARASRGVKGQRWVALTGLIPTKEQMDAFEATFEDALFHSPQRDVPMYLGYQIERADVTSGPDPDQVKWESIDPRRALMTMRRFRSGMTQGSREVVHQKYLPMQPQGTVPLVCRLPPVMNKIWGSEAAHPPEIPLLIEMSLEERGSAGSLSSTEGADASSDASDAPEGSEGPEEADVPEGFGPFGGAAGSFGQGRMPGGMGGMSGMMPGGTGGMSGRMPGGTGGMSGMMPGGTGGMSGMMPGGMGGMSGMMPGAGEMGMGYGTSGAGRMGMRVEKPVEHQLFRFFDFNVEPGRRYQYRVRLGLVNPNYQVEARYLESEELGKKPWIASEDWSEPSEIVLVPRDSRLLAGPVKAPPTAAYEPSAKVVAVTIRMEDGLEAAQDYTVFRGHLANFEGTIDQDSTGGAYGMRGMAGMMPGGSEGMDAMAAMMGGAGPEADRRRTPRQDEDEEEPEKISHATEMLVLDIAGGERLHRSDRSLTVPGGLLLLTPDGNLVVQNELEDLEEYEVYHEPEEKTRPRRSKTKEEDEKRMPGMGTEGGYGAYGMGNADDEGNRPRGKKKRRGSRKPKGAYK